MAPVVVPHTTTLANGTGSFVLAFNTLPLIEPPLACPQADIGKINTMKRAIIFRFILV
jgi:hypothetical protein